MRQFGASCLQKDLKTGKQTIINYAENIFNLSRSAKLQTIQQGDIYRKDRIERTKDPSELKNKERTKDPSLELKNKVDQSVSCESY